MELDVVTLARIQFSLTIMFHYLFPPLTIGLGALMVVLEGLYLKTREPAYERAARFWTQLFAVNFALGVATGIVMEFQFGTNWATYSRFVGDVFGSALAAEGIFAFFLESGFLAVLVFGWDRVGPKMHFFATLMVALGSMFSAVWIVIANSWQQTPAGYHLVKHDGAWRAEITDFWAMVFNPSAMIRLQHVLVGAMLMGAFFMMSISAYYLLKNRHGEEARRSFKVALGAGLLFSALAIFTGHHHAVEVSEYQPAKLAAMEGHWKTGTEGTPLYAFGWPDAARETVHFGLAIPGGLSLLVHGDPARPVTGLDHFAPGDRPPVLIPFLGFHLMVALGTAMLGVTLLATFFWWRGTLWSQRWLLWIFVFAVLAPYTANQAGWVTAEVGRQPWIVYNLLRTSEAVSPGVSGAMVLGTIGMFSLVYIGLFAVWVVVMNDKIQHGPLTWGGPPEHPEPGGFLETAAGLESPDSGFSLTDTHQISPSEDERQA